jgi:hypothetical protein
MTGKRRGIKARLPRNNDPLGFGLRSVPEPLQRLWLINQGNPFFEDDAKDSRLKLGIPAAGFQESSTYVDWAATRRKRHGHDDRLGQGRLALILEGVPLPDNESIIRFTHRDYQMPNLITPPIPCCGADPLFREARSLARRYGIEEAEGEPGFEPIVEDVAGHLLKPAWPPRKSFRGHKVIHETNIVIDASTGQRQRERYLRKELGLESRAGEGGLLPVWYAWWKRWRQAQDTPAADRVLGEIADWTESQYGAGSWYDERSVRRAIEEVDRLLRPVTI